MIALEVMRVLLGAVAVPIRTEDKHAVTPVFAAQQVLIAVSPRPVHELQKVCAQDDALATSQDLTKLMH